MQINLETIIERSKKVWKVMFPILRNKYVLALIIFIVLITIFDDNNLIQRGKSLRELNQLKKDKEYYQQKIKEDQERMNELMTNRKNLEKFAREEYLMKKENEDIFIIIDETDED